MKRSSVKSAAREGLTRKVEVTVPDPDGEGKDEVLVCTVRPLGIRKETRAMLNDLDESVDADEDEVREVLATYLDELLKDWDMEDDDGPVPCDYDTLVEFDGEELLFLFARISEEMQNAPFETSQSSSASKPTTRKTARPAKSSATKRR